MSDHEQNLLRFLANQIGGIQTYRHRLRELAEPDFSFQELITLGDLVFPLTNLRFPGPRDFGSEEEHYEFYNLFDFMICCKLTQSGSSEVTSSLDAYVAATSLAGVCYHQTPDSAEFGIAERCAFFVESLAGMEIGHQILAAQWLDLLGTRVYRSLDRFWSPAWVYSGVVFSSRALRRRALGDEAEKWHTDSDNLICDAFGERHAVKAENEPEYDAMVWLASLHESPPESSEA